MTRRRLCPAATRRSDVEGAHEASPIDTAETLLLDVAATWIEPRPRGLHACSRCSPRASGDGGRGGFTWNMRAKAASSGAAIARSASVHGARRSADERVDAPHHNACSGPALPGWQSPSGWQDDGVCTRRRRTVRSGAAERPNPRDARRGPIVRPCSTRAGRAPRAPSPGVSTGGDVPRETSISTTPLSGPTDPAGGKEHHAEGKEQRLKVAAGSRVPAVPHTQVRCPTILGSLQASTTLAA